MKQIDLNEIPDKVKSRQLDEQQALKELAVFVEKNPVLFGLHRENKDIKSDIILELLEKGYSIFEHFDPSYGTFFTYFFCYVKNLQHNNRRKYAIRNIREYHNVAEYISNYDQKIDSYNMFTKIENEPVKVPYNYRKISINDFKVACNSSEYRILPVYNSSIFDETFISTIDKLKALRPKVAVKTLTVLAFKSAFYITDRQIEKICLICNLDKASFQDTIQKLKNDLMEKQERRERIIMRRNNAYYLHRKLKSELLFDNKENPKKTEIKTVTYLRHTRHWNSLNEILLKGTVNLRPTNKAVADALGICERQVSYYMKNAETLGLEL